MKRMIFISSLILAGCAKVGDYQAKCEQQYSKMSDMAQCLDRSISSDSRLSSAASPKLYVSAAKLLGKGVDEGKISDAQARFELQNLYLNLQRQEAADQQARSMATQQALMSYQAISTMQAIEQNARQPVITQPSPMRVDTYTNCNSGLGNTVTCNSSSNIR
ncbi:general secretion pathway protein GspK [Cronobacter dublinensis]|nr:general secretion pathway protein GspK [Cronobacter dublinensis]